MVDQFKSPDQMDLFSTVTVRNKFSDFSGLILMCKDKPVFDIMRERVYDKDLLPGMMRKLPYKEQFLNWMENRYSSKSNTFARQLRAYVFGQGNRGKINLQTHALSLSDCYWLKRRDDNTTNFSQISPYFSSYWSGEGPYRGQAIPTLYVNGFLPKYWEDAHTLVKTAPNHEAYCAELAAQLGIPVARVTNFPDGIAVTNFTNENVMFEPADASGLINGDDFDNETILDLFGQFGYDMIFFDALVGNGDRHAGNFGYLRDSNTGSYIGPAPLFDFDHAFESNNSKDILIQGVLDYRLLFINRHMELYQKCLQLNLQPYLLERLKSLMLGI